MNFKKNIARFATAAMVITQLAGFTAANAAGTGIVGAKDTMDRQTAGVSAVHTLTFPSATTVAATTITFPAGMLITAVSGTGASTTGNNVVTVSAGNTPNGVTVTALNPAVGSHEIDVTGENSAAIAFDTVTNDTIKVNATVDPSITFDVFATTTACTGTLANSGVYTVDFGHMNVNAINGSDLHDNLLADVNHICTKLSTNATSGAVVTAKNANGADGLRSVSKNTDMIASGADITAGVPAYGMCASTVTGEFGDNTLAVPHYLGGTPSAAFHYGVASCTPSSSGAAAVGAFTGTGVAGSGVGTVQTVWSTTAPTDSAFYELRLKAAISATQPAHNDYTDSIVFVATATF